MSFLFQALSMQFTFDKNDNYSSELILWSCLDFSFIYPSKHESSQKQWMNLTKYNQCNAYVIKLTY